MPRPKPDQERIVEMPDQSIQLAKQCDEREGREK